MCVSVYSIQGCCVYMYMYTCIYMYMCVYCVYVCMYVCVLLLIFTFSMFCGYACDILSCTHVHFCTCMYIQCTCIYIVPWLEVAKQQVCE